MPRASPRAQNLSCIICYTLFFLPAEPLGFPFHPSSSVSSFHRTEGKGSEHADPYLTSHQGPYIIPTAAYAVLHENDMSSLLPVQPMMLSTIIAYRPPHEPFPNTCKYVMWTTNLLQPGIGRTFPRSPARKAIFRLGVQVCVCTGLRRKGRILICWNM